MYATLLEIPHDRIKAMTDYLDVAAARLHPEDARATWGLEPHQAAAARRLEQGGVPATGG